MSLVYTTRLFNGEVNLNQGKPVLFTVPQGKRIIVTDVHGQCQNTTASYLLFFIGSGSWPTLRLDSSATDQSVDFNGRIAYHEGESCTAQSNGTFRFAVTGWLFDGAGGPLSVSTLPGP